jgi:hypothetical protein
MKAPGGRPPLPPSFSLMLWAFAELMRDRQGSQRRLSARAGCQRLAKDFARDSKGGRFLPFSTIRRHHGNVEKDMRKNPEQRAIANGLLEFGRQRRELIGWDASAWLYLIDPAVWQSKGYEGVISGGNIELKKSK